MNCVEWRYHHQYLYARTLVYLPGWATDARVLPMDRLTWNVITPDRPLADTTSFAALAALLHASVSAPVTLLGWSLGGTLALEFARQYPLLVERLLLASLRPSYAAEQVATVKQALRQHRDRALSKFYRQCFFPTQMADYAHFHATWAPIYRNDFSLDALLAGLDYLAATSLPPALPCPALCLHGARDVVAPLGATQAWATAAGAPLRVLAEAAHALPWVEEFVEIVNA
jgi:pimeloyl-ACP methyl ester carboxylesterase